MKRPSYRLKRLLVDFWPERLKPRRSLAFSLLKDISSILRRRAVGSLPERLWPIIGTSKSVYYRGWSQSRPHVVDIFYGGDGIYGSNELKPVRRTLSRSR